MNFENMESCTEGKESAIGPHIPIQCVLPNEPMINAVVMSAIN